MPLFLAKCSFAMYSCMSSNNVHSEQHPSADANELFHLFVVHFQPARTMSELFRIKSAFFCLSNSDSSTHVLNVLNKHWPGLSK